MKLEYDRSIFTQLLLLVLMVCCCAPAVIAQTDDQGSQSESQSESNSKGEDLSRLRPDAPDPIASKELETSIAKGVKHLVDTQNKNGSWGGPQWTGGGLMN